MSSDNVVLCIFTIRMGLVCISTPQRPYVTHSPQTVSLKHNNIIWLHAQLGITNRIYIYTHPFRTQLPLNPFPHHPCSRVQNDPHFKLQPWIIPFILSCFIMWCGAHKAFTFQCRHLLAKGGFKINGLNLMDFKCLKRSLCLTLPTWSYFQTWFDCPFVRWNGNPFSAPHASPIRWAKLSRALDSANFVTTNKAVANPLHRKTLGHIWK